MRACRLRLLGDFRYDCGYLGRSPLLVRGEPNVGGESIAIAAVPTALHRCSKLGCLFPSQGVVWIGKERGNWIANQMSLSRRHQVNSRPIGEFDKTALVDGHDRCWTCLHQRVQPRLPFRTKAPVTNQLANEQSTSGERQGFKAQTNE